MSLSKAICPKCGAEILVNAADDATICQLCGAPFITAKAIDAFSATSAPAPSSIVEPDVFPRCYRVTVKREKDPIIGNAITFLFILNDRPRPLSDDSSISFQSDEKLIEVPVFITNNAGTTFEGVLTGTADGKDIDVVWSVDPRSKTLGKITSSTNDTLRFVEKPGAADNWGHGQV